MMHQINRLSSSISCLTHSLGMFMSKSFRSDWSSPHPRDSGGGDHGDKGIQTFVDQHECGQRCVQLGLQLLKEAVEEE